MVQDLTLHDMIGALVPVLPHEQTGFEIHFDLVLQEPGYRILPRVFGSARGEQNRLIVRTNKSTRNADDGFDRRIVRDLLEKQTPLIFPVFNKVKAVCDIGEGAVDIKEDCFQLT